MSKLIAKCWADDISKQRLLADATATLKAEGEVLPAGFSFVAVENTDKVSHLVIPPKPAELSDEDLDRVSGGACIGDKLKTTGTLSIGSCGYCASSF
jgi:hypothetical protein